MNDVSTQWPFNPITILSQDDDTVTFNITNPFGHNVLALYYQYAAAQTGNTKCYGESPFVACPEPVTVTAHCMTGPEYSLAVVDVWFVDSSSVNSTDSDTVPECCEPNAADAGVPTVLYSLKVYCQSHCPGGGRARDLAVEADSTKSASDFEAVAEKDGAVFEPSKESKEHFCASEDYACGDSGDLVHVCHYSAKDGYQTYCVPESDSDVVAYFPKDYCGPCVGGYGSTTYRN